MRPGEGGTLNLVKDLRTGMYVQEAGRGCRCSIEYASAVVDSISRSRAQVRPHRLRLVPAAAAAEVVAACMAAAMALRVE